MRLYKITSAAHESKVLTTYVGSQADAAAARKQYMALGATRKEIETAEVDVPTDKAGLMTFLNNVLA